MLDCARWCLFDWQTIDQRSTDPHQRCAHKPQMCGFRRSGFELSGSGRGIAAGAILLASRARAFRARDGAGAPTCRSTLLQRSTPRLCSAGPGRGRGDALAIGRVGRAGNWRRVASLMCRRASPIARAVFVEQHLLLGLCHQLEQIARLLPVIIIGVMVVVSRFAFNGQRRLKEFGLVVPQPGAVRVEAGGYSPRRDCRHPASLPSRW